MSTYCQIGDKAILTYQFTGKSQNIIKFEFSPIEVETKKVASNATSNYSNIGFGFSAYSTNEFYAKSYILTDYYVVDRKIPIDTYEYRYRYELHGKQCGESEFIALAYIDPNSIIINPNVKCPVPEEADTLIQVAYNNKVVFKDQDKADVFYSVSCGDCPAGQCRCVSSGYPGYCCLDCNATAEQIRSITNMLRSKNG